MRRITGGLLRLESFEFRQPMSGGRQWAYLKTLSGMLIVGLHKVYHGYVASPQI